MSVNKYKPHVLVLPEDDANSELAGGFVLETKFYRNIQILPQAGGWLNVCRIFLSEHVKAMRTYPDRYIVLLFDFDDQIDRLEKVREHVPEDLRSRVFLLGTKSEPEALKIYEVVSKSGDRSFEGIGRSLARECREGTRGLWSHPLLQHNDSEIKRLEGCVWGFLF